MDISAAGYSSVQCNPTGMPAHDFQDKHALMARRRRMHRSSASVCTINCAIESKRKRRGQQIVVDRLRNTPTTGISEFVKLLGQSPAIHRRQYK